MSSAIRREFPVVLGFSYERGVTSQFSPTTDDITWWKNLIQKNKLHDYQETKNNLRKGINPRTRDQQLQDLLQYKGISHYEEPEASNHTTLPCPGELLVEEHYSNYGESWARGRDVLENDSIESGLRMK